MNRTYALRPGEYAEGPRIVSTTLRPVRPAVLIPQDDPGLAARFAESRSLAWGGHVGFALPFSRSEGLREPWRRLLDVLDPDQVYALGISSRPVISPGVVNMRAPHAKPPRSLAERMQDGLGRLLYTAEEEHAMTLPELTLRGLQITCRGTAHGANERSGDGRGARRRPIVVTGEEGSVEDFALFWNLRSEHYFARPFPVWMPLDLLEDAEAPAAIENVLRRVRPSVGEPWPRKEDLLIVSASVGSDELRDRLGDLYPEARIGTEDLVGLFTETCEYY